MGLKRHSRNHNLALNLNSVLHSPKKNKITEAYYTFNELDGSHPWQEMVPEGFVSYHVRELQKGEVAYFNFELAKEMGLIDNNHPHVLNSELKQKILETFSIQIINEYDQSKNRKFKNHKVKDKKFMATRYLQLQHPNKTGKTSGDGRTIWNGTFNYDGTVWDVSSRGTGVTCLSPGFIEAGKPLKTGSTDFGYGCGKADLDELFSAALMAEIFHRQGIHTERVLAIIDTGNKLGIGVRAGKNLLRPAHIFCHLKQGNYEACKRSTEYLIQRQIQNKEWNISINSKRKYDLMMEELTHTYADFVATLETDYIFFWIDWDGDNFLANGGIIDYGSIRQFGLRYDQYRYDDVSRFSTNLNEQKNKAKLLIQTFAQLVSFIKTKDKKPIQDFSDSIWVKKFEQKYEEALLNRYLYRTGFTLKQRETLLTEHKEDVLSFFKIFRYFENVKAQKKYEEIADGINKQPAFNMRSFLRVYPKLLNKKSKVTFERIYELICPQTLDHTLDFKDINLKKLDTLLMNYECLIKKTIKNSKQFESFIHRSKIINRVDRITGNSVDVIISETLKKFNKGELSYPEIQKVMDAFIKNQAILPEDNGTRISRFSNLKSLELFKNYLTLVDGYREDI